MTVAGVDPTYQPGPPRDGYPPRSTEEAEEAGVNVTASMTCYSANKGPDFAGVVRLASRLRGRLVAVGVGAGGRVRVRVRVRVSVSVRVRVRV